MEAIILAGGSGTRLRSLVNDLPKPMASVQGRPFLEWQLAHLQRKGIDRVILCIGYLAEKIASYFGRGHRGMKIIYSQEERPLGTGGAIRLAFQKIHSSCCLVLNGDSLFDVDLAAMGKMHAGQSPDLTMALKVMDQAGRFGSVALGEDGRVMAFEEKAKAAERRLVNGGVYMASPRLFEGTDLPEAFSFENDFLAPMSQQRRFKGFLSDGFFIDIGVPEDYRRAQTEPYFQTLAEN